MPEVYLILLEFLPFGLLANYALLRHAGSDTNILALMLLLEGVGAAFYDINDYQGTIFTAAGFSLGIGLFLNHLDERHGNHVRWLTIFALFLLPPVFLLITATSRGAAPAFQGIALGGMVASAWASTFPRESVRSGAVIVMLGSMIAIQWPGHWLSWPLFFVGNLVLAIGVTSELRARDAG
ncbi:hypothetical protein WBP07_06370 [Novosphingobium sp. BL-8A]|uniref:hypothetical protein n=1 Tax=Novosphingobium sp. BL-8A TaxID=3127639 RepID=UPI003756EBA2